MASSNSTEGRLTAALVGRYRIEREIGSGGMATVYLAEDLRHHRKVAVKVLKPDLAQAVGAARFLREIEVAANLMHPHILPVFDSGEAEGLLYYVMPYVDGGSLRDRLEEESQLSVEEAASIAREIADALAHAHDRDVIHRDVKPGNILLSGGHALLADFGLAQAVAGVGSAHLTHTGIAVGTPAYMSPEQVTGELELDGRSDQYALGCVLFEMLAGQPPFTGPSGESITRQHLTVDPPQVRLLRPTVPNGVADALRKTLAKSRADRFPTAARLGAALRAGVEAETPSQTGLDGGRGEGEHPRSALRRLFSRPIATAVGVAAILAVVVVGYVAFLPDLTGTEEAVRVVVLPLQNQTDEPSRDPVSLQAADYIRQILTRAELMGTVGPLARIRVSMSGGSTEGVSRPNPSEDWPQETGADMAVLGSLYGEGESLRVHLDIVDRSATVLGTVEVTGPLSGPSSVYPQLQTRVLGTVAGIVAPGHEWSYATEGRQAPTLEALEAVKEGWAAHERQDEEGAVQAVQYFRQAAALDPDYLVPLIELAGVFVHWNRAAEADSVCRILEGRSGEMSPWQRLRSEMLCASGAGDNVAALSTARRMTRLSSRNWHYVGFHALSLNRPREAVDAFSRFDPELDRGSWGAAPAVWELWALALHMLGEHERELEVLRERRERFTHAREIPAGEARALVAQGRTGEAEVIIDDWESNLTPGWNPRDQLNLLANEFAAHGDPQRARTLWARALEWDSARPQAELATSPSKAWRAMCLLLLDRVDEAESLAASFAETTGDPYALYGTFLLGISSAKRGNRTDAERYSEVLRGVGRPGQRGRLTMWRAMISANLGDLEQAVWLLGQAAEEGMTLFRFRPDHEPFFEPLWGYPAFLEFVRPKG